MTIYGDEHRRLQDRFDTRRLADRIEDVLVKDTLSDSDRAFVEARDMFFLATCDADGQPTVSYKGGDPGFVRVIDERTIAFPNYDGNGMYLSLGNVLQHAPVGMLFIDFERQNRMRVDGEAHIDLDDPLIDQWPRAQLVVRVTTLHAGRALAVRAPRRGAAARARLEAHGLGLRRVAGRRPGPRVVAQLSSPVVPPA